MLAMVDHEVLSSINTKTGISKYSTCSLSSKLKHEPEGHKFHLLLLRLNKSTSRLWFSLALMSEGIFVSAGTIDVSAVHARQS